MATYPLQSGLPRHPVCTDHVVGAILSGWRYDLSGIPAHLRGDYDKHLDQCVHCHRRQRLHRTVDMLLFAATTLSLVAFLLAAVVLHRLRTFSHLTMLHVRLLPEATLIHAHIPASITISLQAVALLGVFVSMLLLVLVTIATPVPLMVSGIFREHVAPAHKLPESSADHLDKQAA